MKRMMIMMPILLVTGMVSAETPATVDSVDIGRYAGLWYEIARIPNRFQGDCAGNVTAEYSLREDGLIDVINRCINREGTLDTARGIAKVVDSESNARLKVSFVRFLGLPLFWGNYWILGLDDMYKWAVVGTPDRKYGWILSRTPELSESDRETIRNLLTSKGYNTDRFKETYQTLDE